MEWSYQERSRKWAAGPRKDRHETVLWLPFNWAADSRESWIAGGNLCMQAHIRHPWAEDWRGWWLTHRRMHGNWQNPWVVFRPATILWNPSKNVPQHIWALCLKEWYIFARRLCEGLGECPHLGTRNENPERICSKRSVAFSACLG